ncbi:NosL [compost metagenome]
MRYWKLLFIVVLGVLLLSACGRKYVAAEIHEDVDICEICNMQVKDDAYAAQLTTKEGKTYKFDDIGCLNQWKVENGAEQIGMAFVRDFNDMTWLEYDQATYVYDESIRTPMAYGIVNFKDKESADAFVKDHGVGQVLTAADLSSHDWKQNTEMMDMHMEGDSMEHMGDKSKTQMNHENMTEQSGHN